MRTVIAWLRHHWKVVAPVAVAGLAVGAYLFFGVFGVHLLWVDDKVDEAGPVFDSAAAEEAPEATTTTVDLVPESSPTTAPTTTVPQVVAVAAGSFIDRSHPTSGTATVLNDGTTQRFVRFDDFSTDNGPDLDVYLTSAGPDASPGEIAADFVDLGALKGNIGAQNYEVDPGVDLQRYNTVVIWCTRFSVAFGAAELSTP